MGPVDGQSSLDYSSGARNSWTESSLNENNPLYNPLLGGPLYRVRFYTPASAVAGTPAPKHCNGTQILDNAQMVRIESRGIVTPDWNSNGIVDGGTYSQDINFDGSTSVGDG